MSSHFVNPNALKKKLEKNKILWNRFVFDSNSLGESQDFSSSDANTPSTNMPRSTSQSTAANVANTSDSTSTSAENSAINSYTQ